MSILFNTASGFIQVKALRNLAHTPQRCVAMIFGARPSTEGCTSVDYYRVNSVKAAKSLVKGELPVVFNGPTLKTFGDRAIPLESADVIISDMHVLVHPDAAYTVTGTMRAAHDISKYLEQLKDAPEHDWVIIDPRIISGSLACRRGGMEVHNHYITDVGGSVMRLPSYSEVEMRRHGYGFALSDYRAQALETA